MNSTDILFNNGQLNWDAISTISNIILVTALVLVTLWYAWQVRKQTKSMEKGMRKNRILEEIQDVLTPTIYSLEKEIENRLTQLKELDGHLLDKIKEKREKYREEYHFTKYEIDQQLKELEERLM